MTVLRRELNMKW